MGYNCDADIKLLEHINFNSSENLIIFDARPYSSALANRVLTIINNINTNTNNIRYMEEDLRIQISIRKQKLNFAILKIFIM